MTNRAVRKPGIGRPRERHAGRRYVIGHYQTRASECLPTRYVTRASAEAARRQLLGRRNTAVFVIEPDRPDTAGAEKAA